MSVFPSLASPGAGARALRFSVSLHAGGVCKDLWAHLQKESIFLDVDSRQPSLGRAVREGRSPRKRGILDWETRYPREDEKVVCGGMAARPRAEEQAACKDLGGQRGAGSGQGEKSDLFGGGHLRP